MTFFYDLKVNNAKKISKFNIRTTFDKLQNNVQNQKTKEKNKW